MFDFYKFALCRLKKRTKWMFILTILTAMMVSVSSIMIPVVQKLLISNVVEGYLNKRGIVIICVISIMGILATIVEALFLNSLMMSLKRRVQEELLTSAIRNKNSIIEEKGAGAYMVSVFGDSEQIALLIETNIFYILFHCIAVVVVLLITMRWSPLFAQLVIPAYLFMIMIHVVADRIYIKKFQAGRELVYEVNPKTLEYIENRQTILNFANIKKYEKTLFSLFDKRDTEFKAAYAVNVLSSTLLNAISTIVIVLFFCLSLFEIANGKMEVSEFVAMTSYFSMIFAPIQMVKQYCVKLHKYKTVKAKIQESLLTEIKYKIPENDGLMMEGCSYSYEEEGDKKCVENISLKIEEKIALVGLSGEGKTTIIKMLIGELCPQKGRCIYGEQNVGDISKYIIRSSIRFYSQDIEIFNQDLHFNITLGKIGLTEAEYKVKIKEIENILEHCFSVLSKSRKNPKILSEKERELLQEIYMLKDDFGENSEDVQKIIENLPENKEWITKNIAQILTSRRFYILERYQNIIEMLELTKLEGRNLGQRGVQISGGEKNRVAMARFLLPEYPTYFILDEPFTNLDLISENVCMKVLKSYSKGWKGILISHKMNIVRDFADKICVLENGEMVEMGSHNELIKSNGLYQMFYETYEKGHL